MKDNEEIRYVDLDDLLFILALDFPIIFLAVILKYFGLNSDSINAFLLIPLSVMTIWGFHLSLKKKDHGIGLWFKISSFGPDLIWSIITFPAVFGIYILMGFLTSFIWSGNDANAILMNPNEIIAVISLGLFLPVMEEVIFRGAIYEYIKRFYSPEFSMVLTSIAFAVVHPFEQWMKIFVFGMLLNLLYYKRGTLTVSSTVHVMVNLIYISIFYLPKG
ncbi:CPBP family intramembrane glutamic endopeptidase [Athalassotoga saccharophila]|uniref:CPBP family intramembrane glutamic endopeptidase n=1 Tax=Athalassotoga saccharophila TaxID=1441386 RepID=UPI00137B848A|nr:type II CAAX endopeptidase family protein [Athalassotoga saccharophila]BBJ29002.1 CAAX amino terminal protease family [Athalassotoga saccharophila]